MSGEVPRPALVAAKGRQPVELPTAAKGRQPVELPTPSRAVVRNGQSWLIGRMARPSVPAQPFTRAASS